MKKGLLIGLVLAIVCVCAFPIAIFAAGPTNVAMTWSGTNVNVGNTVKLGDDQIASFQSVGSLAAGTFTATYLSGRGDQTSSTISATTVGKGFTNYAVASMNGGVQTGVSASFGATSINDATTTKNDAVNSFTFNQTASGMSVATGILAYVGSNSINAGMSAGLGNVAIKGYLNNVQK